MVSFVLPSQQIAESLPDMTDEKKTEAITIKLSETAKRFVDSRCRQEGMESSGEYIRSLIEADRQKAADNLNLLAEALGVQINHENLVMRGSAQMVGK